MDPHFVAGEERPSLFQASPSPSPSSSSSTVRDGYFAAQALRASYLGRPVDAVRWVDVDPLGRLLEPVSAREILQRELLKQRIREEIIAREVMPEMRLLEEEVRRELEVERALAVRFLRESAFSSAGGAAPALSEARFPLAPHFGSGVGGEKRVVGLRPVGERSAGESVFGERLVGEGVSKSVLPQSEHDNKGLVSMSAHNADLSKNSLAGIERKITNVLDIAEPKAFELPGPAKLDWSCALCQVSASSRKVLDEHLQGRKHRAKLLLLRDVTKEVEGPTSTMRADKLFTKGAGPTKAYVTLEGKNIYTKETGLRPVKKQKTVTSLWCELCKLQCNDNKTLASHLDGKKHRTRLEAAQSKSVAAAAVAEKKIADAVHNKDGKEAISASQGAEDGTGMVEEPVVEKQEPEEVQHAAS